MKPKIGVTTSSLGIKNPADAIEKAREMGFSYIQLGGLDYFLGGFCGLKRIQAFRLAELNRDIIYSVTVPSNAEEWEKNTRAIALIASQSGINMLSGHTINKGAEYDTYYLNSVFSYLREKGIRFAVETGTESPEKLLSALDHLRNPFVGISFDIANFLIYRTATLDQAFDALKVPEFAARILQVHIKDAVEGQETVLGKGAVPVKEYIQAVQSTGYTGPLILETGGPFELRKEKTEKSKAKLDEILAEI